MRNVVGAQAQALPPPWGLVGHNGQRQVEAVRLHQRRRGDGEVTWLDLRNDPQQMAWGGW